jgi:hypothetical protein
MSDCAEGFPTETLHVQAKHDDGGVTIVVVGEFDMTGQNRSGNVSAKRSTHNRCR